MKMKPTENFKVEIYFDPAAANLADVCAETDEIFSGYDMPCLVRKEDCRIYTDTGDPKDFGKLYAAINKVSDKPYIINAINDGYFDRGDRRDTLMTSFFEKAAV
jgi:hypothetical protein